MDPSGKACIVTGGARGLGKEVTKHLLERGAKVGPTTTMMTMMVVVVVVVVQMAAVVVALCVQGHNSQTIIQSQSKFGANFVLFYIHFSYHINAKFCNRHDSTVGVPL